VSDLFDNAPPPELSSLEVQWLFVDEAGDPTLFHRSGKPIVDTPGCSRFFIIGKLEVEEPVSLAKALTDLRQELLADPYFAGVESFRPEREKTALLFHAKDDLPEVRYRVFNLLRSAGKTLRFHAVICDKLALGGGRKQLTAIVIDRSGEPLHKSRDERRDHCVLASV